MASAIILTFFATQIYYAHDTKLPYKIGIIVVIAVVGFAGIHALLTPDLEDPPPGERLYTADEVAALVAAVQSGRLVAAAPQTCKFCQGAQPDATGVDGSRYHSHCFQAAYQRGKT
ncbi:MAG TPA: hypothetical protein VNG31_10015 [Candidatus Baltobacteraceae bacterium]|nr:hypothetical protein [Candidatus Baltobacteraceae bacterium]